MSAVFSTIDTSSLNKPRPISDEVVVGKDVLELLAGAMYADPLTIFREYVQNAADSIELARELGASAGDEFGVQVTLDRASRSILVRDNGVSIPEREFVKRLTTIGASGKRGKKLRGFRGVGRLSGLGYCQELVFRGRAQGDAKVSELRWDGRRLRDLLRDATYDGDLSGLIRSVVEHRRIPPDGFPERFFEVELRKVTRLRGDLLLNDAAIRSYLTQVAPVPFHPEFSHGPKIQAFLTSRGVAEPIVIKIDGDVEPIFHRARDQISFSQTIVDTVRAVEFLELRGQDGEVDAYGWLLEHSYLGAVPRRLAFGGIRLRAGNIQVGTESVMSQLFVEPRFASWAIGDIHVCSPKIIPNARRDEFEAGVHYSHLQDELSILVKRITQTIRDSSIARNRVRKTQFHLGVIDQWLEHAVGDSLPPPVALRVQSILDGHISAAIKESSKLDPESLEASNLTRRMNASATSIKKLATRIESSSSPGRRSARDKAIDVALGVILEHALTPHAGLTMSKRILSAFEAS